MKHHGTNLYRLLCGLAGIALAHGAAAMTLDQPTCELTLSGSWNPGGLDVCTVHDMDLPSGDILSVPAGTKLNLHGASVLRGHNLATGQLPARLDVLPAGILTIVDDLTNRGVINVDGEAEVDGSLTNGFRGMVEVNGTFVSSGDITNTGTARWFVMQQGSLESEGTFFNEGLVSNTGNILLSSGSMNNHADLVNSGSAAALIIEDGATLFNETAGSLLMNANSGRIGNDGVIINTAGAQLTNDSSSIVSTGRIVNYDDATLDNLNGSLIANVGASSEIENRDGAWIRNDSFIHNLSVIENICSAMFENLTTGVVSNIPGKGRFDNFGGAIINVGIINLPPVQNACPP